MEKKRTQNTILRFYMNYNLLSTISSTKGKKDLDKDKVQIMLVEEEEGEEEMESTQTVAKFSLDLAWLKACSTAPPQNNNIQRQISCHSICKACFWINMIFSLHIRHSDSIIIIHYHHRNQVFIIIAPSLFFFFLLFFVYMIFLISLSNSICKV